MRASMESKSFYGEGTDHYKREDYLADVLLQKKSGPKLDIPDWFKLENYSYLLNDKKDGKFITTGISVWYEQLLIRKAIIFELLNPKSLLIDLEMDALITQTQTNGRGSVQSERAILTIGGADLRHIKSKRSPSSLSARALSPAEIALHLSRLPWGEKVALIDILNSASVPEAIKKIEEIGPRLVYPLLAPVHPESNYIFEINRFAQKDIVLQQIDDFLTKYSVRDSRQAFDISKAFEMAIIPYIDLMIYAFKANGRITRKKMADALFPENENKGEENIRNTTSRLAFDYLTYVNLQSMYSQIKN